MLAGVLAQHDLTRNLRQLLGDGVLPSQIADLTPHQLFAVLFRDAERAEAEPIDTLHAINRERAERGEPPAVPQWFAPHLPRKKR